MSLVQARLIVLTDAESVGKKVTYVYSCHARPSRMSAESKAMLERLVLDAKGRGPKVTACDFNAWGQLTDECLRTLLMATSLLTAEEAPVRL